MTNRDNLNVRWSIFVVILIVVCCLGTKTAGSAIPMWEYLTRDEKMSHIYKIFSKQVARYCSNSPLPDCNKNFLMIGIKSLANIDDNKLEKIDPYQRGSKDTIWRAMIGERRVIESTFGQDDLYYNNLDASSGSINNRLEEEEWSPINDYARTSNQRDGPYLVGPSVIRVFPDGRPVPEDAKKPLPRDDDLDDLKYPKIPSFTEIEANSERFFYKKPTYHSMPESKRNTIYNNRKSLSSVQWPSSLISTMNYSHYRRVNPVFRERRVNADEKISVNTRPIRIY